MINEAELRRMTHDERRELARALPAIDLRHPLVDPRLRRRRTLALLVADGLEECLPARLRPGADDKPTADVTAGGRPSS